MKKVLIAAFVFLAMSTSLYAQNEIPFIVGWDDEMPLGHGGAKSPIATPLVYLDAHTLTFSTTHPEYMLYIKDENETVVYSTVVSESETTVVLPAALSGNYEIVLVMGNWMFTGWIEL